jgi:hypothetical protein
VSTVERLEVDPADPARADVPDELAPRGVRLVAATVDGRPAVLERIAPEDVRDLLT